MTNQRADISSVLGNIGIDLRDKIFEAPTFHQKTKVAIDFLNDRLKALHLKYKTVEKVIAKMHQTKLSEVKHLVADSCLSQRQFERHFKELIGFSARTYIKLHRFERVLESASVHPNMSEGKLMDLALTTGYYDQAHMIHHFKVFTGLTPRAYFSNMTSQPQYQANVV